MKKTSKWSTTMMAAVAAAFGFTMLAAWAGPAVSAVPTDQQVLVDEAQIVLSEFQTAPEMELFREAVKDARGMLIVPNLFRAGLMIGGSGGKGVYMARDAKTGEWVGPSFYNLGSFTFGLQIGGQNAQVVILAMTDDAARAMLSSQFKMGADASYAVGPVGTGAAGNVMLPPAAFVSFARTKGAYAGLTLEGTVVTVDKGDNSAYYDGYVTTEDILVRRSVVSPHAAGLREEAKKAYKCC